MGKLAVQAVASLTLAVASAELYTYSVFPGQQLSSTIPWRIETWGPNSECVVKHDAVPFALLKPTSGGCPVDSTFDFHLGREVPWNKFPLELSAPTVHEFKGIEYSLLHDPFCNNNDDAIQNRKLLNEALAQLSPGDTLSIPGKYCIAAGVVGDRLTHVTIDLRGELFFSQSPDDWGNGNGLEFYGATNLTITSSNKQGLIHTKACTEWYIQRDLGKAGGPTLVNMDMDRNLSFASSQIVVENLRIHNSPGYHFYINKGVHITVRHMDVRVTCLANWIPFKAALKNLAQQTDGIDIWGTDVHVHDVNIDNGDDCICVKGGDDGSGIISENWLVENSTASGLGLTVGTLGWGHHMPVRNVTFRNIHMPHTTKGIYVKPPYNNVTDVLFQNISIDGAAVQFPVFIGPVHQFDGDCPWTWPLPGHGTCSVSSGDYVTEVKIDGLKINRRIPGITTQLDGSSDFLIMGNDRTKTRVWLSNIEIVGGKAAQCSDPPASLTGTCDNACYAAEVHTDGSYQIQCTEFASKVEDGACAPLIGKVEERCPSGAAHKDSWCVHSGLRCNSSSFMV